MAKFLSNINLETANDIQFKTTAGANAGKISQTGDDLVISNAVGDILLGNGSDDIYIGDGTNAVDIRFEQNMSIFADSSSTKTLTIGGLNTNLVLDSPTFSGTVTLGATTINNKLTFTTANGYILFDYEPSGDTGEYTSEVPLIKIDHNGTEKTILSRISENAAIQLGHDDTVLITAGDVGDVMKSNWGATNENVVLASEGGFYAYGFPGNDPSWSNRNEFRFRSDSTTASDNGLYIGDGSNTQFIDVNRNLKNIGSITATSLDINGAADISGATTIGGDVRLNSGELFLTEAGSARKPVRLYQSGYKGAVALERDGVGTVRITGASEVGDTYFNASNVNVGIGTSTPSAKLDVVGEVKATSLDIDGASDFNSGTENVIATFTSTDSIGEIRIADNSKYTRLLTVGDTFKIMPSDGDEVLNVSDSAVTVGVDDSGVDVILYGATSGKKMQWDQSADTLIVDGTLDVNGSADISGNLTLSGGALIGDPNWDIYAEYTNRGRINLLSNNSADTNVQVALMTNGTNRLTIDKAGTSTFAGDVLLGDSKKVKFGDNPDLQIYHNGSHSFIQDIGDGDLRLLGSSIKLQNTSEANILTLASDLSATFAGNVTVSGNLTINGTTVTVDTTNLNVQDKNITLNYSTSDSSASADGAGITIQDAVNSSTDATILWDATNDEFDFSHKINVTGAITSSGQITGTELEGTSLDINGNADIAGSLSVTNNAGTLNLVGTNHSYIQWYPDGISAGRKAYTGYGGATDNNFSITNEISGGNVKLNTNAGIIQLLSNTVVSGELEATSLDINGNADISGTCVTGNLECSDLDIGGTATGDGSGLTDLNGSQITTGTVAAARVATLNQNTTGSAASLSGLSLGDIVAGGESGYTTVSGNTASSNKFLRSRGAASTATIPAFETIGASDISGLGSLATASTISNSNWSGTDLSVANGGTGRSSLSSGQVLLGNGTSGINSRAIGISDDNIVEIDSSSVASGEYARFTANGLESRSTSEVLSDIGAQAAGSYLTSVATSNIADNAVTFAKLQDMTRGSIIAANNSGHPYELTIGSNGQVLKADGNGDIVWANESGGTAGTLIDISSGTISVDLTEATAATIANGDFILFLDGGTNSAAAKGDIHDVANLFAGTGLTATDSVISVNLGNGLAMDGANISLNLDGSTLALGQNGIKVGTTQDTIQTIYNTNLIVGRASSDMAIEFNTADQIDITHNGTTYARFDNDGDLFLARDWHIGQSFSDIKLKENIKDFKNGLDAILQLKPVTFDWKDKERGSNHTGFIAQDVEKIIPNAVNKRKKLEDDNLNEYLSIDNSQIIATLTKAVQEQQKQINELKEIINGISK